MTRWRGSSKGHIPFAPKHTHRYPPLNLHPLQIKLITTLLKCGVDPDTEDRQGNTALYYAVQGSHDRMMKGLSCIRVLLAAGATQVFIRNVLCALIKFCVRGRV